MESWFSALPDWIQWAIVLAAVLWLGGVLSLGLAAVVAPLAFLFDALAYLLYLPFKAIIVLFASRKPPHSDAGDYRLEQGREVRSERFGRQDIGDKR